LDSCLKWIIVMAFGILTAKRKPSGTDAAYSTTTLACDRTTLPGPCRLQNHWSTSTQSYFRAYS
jgi:hypothetical protein